MPTGNRHRLARTRMTSQFVTPGASIDKRMPRSIPQIGEVCTPAVVATMPPSTRPSPTSAAAPGGCPPLAVTPFPEPGMRAVPATTCTARVSRRRHPPARTSRGCKAIDAPGVAVVQAVAPKPVNLLVGRTRDRTLAHFSALGGEVSAWAVRTCTAASAHSDARQGAQPPLRADCRGLLPPVICMGWGRDCIHSHGPQALPDQPAPSRAQLLGVRPVLPVPCADVR